MSDRPALVTQIAQENSNPPPTIEKKIQTKIESTLVELTKQSTTKVTLGQLSQEFQRRYKLSISATLKQHKLPQSPLKFIQKSCANKIKVEVNNKKHYTLLV